MNNFGKSTTVILRATEDKQLAQGVLEGLILKHLAKQSLQRQAAARKRKA